MDLMLLLKVLKPVIADEAMALMAVSLIAVVCFCGCCFQLIRASLTPIPVINQTPYSKTALRVSKGYQVAAWAMMSCVFLAGLVISFSQVFTQL